MTELEIWQKIARRAYRDNAKAFKAYMATEYRTLWAEQKLGELMGIELEKITVRAERAKAMRGIEKAYDAMSPTL